MANSDIQGALVAFRKVGDDAAALRGQLQGLGGQGISSAQAQALESLAVLAREGESLLASGAKKARSEQIDALTNQIAGLNAGIAFGADIAATNAKIAALTAQRATLSLEEAGDFSEIISPAKVNELLALAARVHDAALQKQAAAEIIGIVDQVVKTATDVAGGIAAFA
jgi:hypothetical protein